MPAGVSATPTSLSKWLLISLPLLFLLAIGLTYGIAGSRSRVSAGSGPVPHDHLWTAIFRDGKKTNIVMADSARADLEQVVERDSHSPSIRIPIIRRTSRRTLPRKFAA